MGKTLWKINRHHKFGKLICYVAQNVGEKTRPVTVWENHLLIELLKEILSLSFESITWSNYFMFCTLSLRNTESKYHKKHQTYELTYGRKAAGSGSRHWRSSRKNFHPWKHFSWWVVRISNFSSSLMNDWKWDFFSTQENIIHHHHRCIIAHTKLAENFTTFSRYFLCLIVSEIWW